MKIHNNMSRKQVEEYGRLGATLENRAKILNTFYLNVNKDEKSIGQWLSKHGYWEPWITAWMSENIKPGFKCIDLGANYGYYTRVMEFLVGVNGKVYAIEANPNLISMLQSAVESDALSGAGKIEYCCVAISNSEGKCELHIPPRFIGGSSIVHGILELPSEIEEKEWTEKVSVDMTTLDKLISEDHIDLIKIDIEGSEPLAWKGMPNTLKNTDVVVIELGRYTPAWLLDEIYKGYNVTKINFDGKEELLNQKDFEGLDDLVMAVLRKREYN
jgi:FkbM family methyltransferase